MSEVAENVIDIVCKVINAAGWIVAILLLFGKKIKAHFINKNAASENQKIVKNQASQLEKEKELKDMAKFLCDRCGKETAVKDGVHYESPDLTCDVCETCFTALTERDAKIKQAKADLEAAEQRVIEARARLLDLTGGNTAKTDEKPAVNNLSELTTQTPTAHTEAAKTDVTADDVIKKIGL